MNRRQFLEDVASIMGLAAGGTALGGCATHRGVRFDAHEPLDVGGYVASVDDQLAGIRAHPTHPVLAETLREEGLPGDLVQRSLAALLVAGAFRDLPRSAQADPRVQALVAREAQPMGKAALAHAAWLDRMPRKRRRELRRTLRRERELMAAIRGDLGARGRAKGVSPERTWQLDATLDDLDWRLTRQEPDLVLGEAIDKVDRDASAHHLARDQWAPASADPDEAFPAVDLAREFELDEPRSKQTARTGLRVMGIGAIVLAGSGAMIGLGALGGGDVVDGEGLGSFLLVTGLFGATTGVVMILVGIFYQFSAAIQRMDEASQPLTIDEEEEIARRDAARARARKLLDEPQEEEPEDWSEEEE